MEKNESDLEKQRSRCFHDSVDQIASAAGKLMQALQAERSEGYQESATGEDNPRLRALCLQTAHTLWQEAGQHCALLELRQLGPNLFGGQMVMSPHLLAALMAAREQGPAADGEKPDEKGTP